MAKTLHDDVFDAGLNVVKNSGTTLIFTAAEPANYAAISALVTKTGLTSGSYTGPANGDTSGRKLTVSAQTAMTPSSNGTVGYAVITDGSARILAGTSVTSQAVTTAQTWNSPAFDIELNDPS